MARKGNTQVNGLRDPTEVLCIQESHAQWDGILRGFGATVTYSDGYSEILKIQELEVLMLADRARKTDIGARDYSQGHVWARYCRKATIGFGHREVC